VGPAFAAVRDRILRLGPIGFDEYVELALYAPGAGFYATTGAAGRADDFLTSPELGPLFGAVVARALDRWWEELGAPDPFVVSEAAAGAGTLAKAILAAAPECAPALRYLLVERSAALRERQPVALAVEPPALVLGPMLADEDGADDGLQVLPGRGPLVTSLTDLPAGPLTGVVLANELLDNLAFQLLELTPAGWAEVRVGLAEESTDRLVEVLTPAENADAEAAARLAPLARAGDRIPLQRAAGEWLRQALRTLRVGRVVVVDYAANTAQLASRPTEEWLRTYRAGGPGGHPLERPGSQDITCEVCIDQLGRVHAPSFNRTQAEFLDDHGIDVLVDIARAAWQSGAASPDLAALAARSRVSESAALRDPNGLGAFRVLEWVVG